MPRLLTDRGMGNGNSWRVLIIEDESIDREIYKRYLGCSSAFHFEFAESDSAAGGIEISRSWQPDCILLDFNLKDMDGLEVLPRLRNGGEHLPCAVVMLTAFGGEELAVKAMKNGAMDYLPKGQVVGDLLPQTVVNAIRRFELQRRIEQQRVELERRTLQYQTLLEAIPQKVWTADSEGRVEYANSQWSEFTGLDAVRAGELGWDDLVHPDDRENTWSAWNQARQTGTIFEIEHRLRRASDGAYCWHLARAVPFRAANGQIVNWFGTCTEIENQKQAETLNLQREKLQSLGQLAAGLAHDFNNLLVAVLCGASYARETLPPTHPVQEILKGVIRAGERAAELTSKMLAYAGLGNQHIEPTDLNQLVVETCDSLRESISREIFLDVQIMPGGAPLTTDPRRMRQVVAELVMNAAESIRKGSPGVVIVRTYSREITAPAVSGQPPDLAPGCYVVLEVHDNGCGMHEEILKRIFDPFFSTKFLGRGLGLAAVQGFVRSNGGDVQVESSPGDGTSFRILLPTAETSESRADRATCSRG
uniref:histidine kinase n=1 Tax=Solibacter usitatus (strain Ellin6076) TaxID=234267 RepID=Q026N5_SOLUE